MLLLLAVPALLRLAVTNLLLLLLLLLLAQRVLGFVLHHEEWSLSHAHGCRSRQSVVWLTVRSTLW
jgi:hypothetical protein